MSKLYLIFGVGVAEIAATGTGLGVYYGISSDSGSDKQKVVSQEQNRDTGSEGVSSSDGPSLLSESAESVRSLQQGVPGVGTK